MSEAETPIPASDLPTRFAAGVVMIAVALLATWWGGWPFRLLIAAAAAAMLLEWSDIHRVPRLWAYLGMAILALSLLAGAEALYPVEYQPVAAGPDAFAENWYAFASLALIALLLGLLARRLAMIAGFLYVAIPAFALLSLSWVWVGLVLWVFAVTWATDIFAYFAGRSIGGPKLVPRISPNKTWSGLLGGMAGAALFGWLAGSFFGMGAQFLAIGAVMGFVAQAGDLFESWVKRRAGVKDSGTMLPGHGGVLDRLDGLIAVAFATTLLLMSGLLTA